MKKNKIQRQFNEMVASLESQLKLIADYSYKAFDQQQSEYLPEIATKLRVLLIRSGSNKPLLFEVAARLNLVLNITLDKDAPPVEPIPGEPIPGETITLDRYFDLNSVMVGTSNGLVAISKRNLIRAWSEQLGGAHVDWALDESLKNALEAPFLIDNMPLLAQELKSSAKIALDCGTLLLEKAKASNQK